VAGRGFSHRYSHGGKGILNDPRKYSGNTPEKHKKKGRKWKSAMEKSGVGVPGGGYNGISFKEK